MIFIRGCNILRYGLPVSRGTESVEPAMWPSTDNITISSGLDYWDAYKTSGATRKIIGHVE